MPMCDVYIPEDALGLWLLDTIVDGMGGPAIAATRHGDEDGPPAWLENVHASSRATRVSRSRIG